MHHQSNLRHARSGPTSSSVRPCPCVQYMPYRLLHCKPRHPCMMSLCIRKHMRACVMMSLIIVGPGPDLHRALVAVLHDQPHLALAFGPGASGVAGRGAGAWCAPPGAGCVCVSMCVLPCYSQAMLLTSHTCPGALGLAAAERTDAHCACTASTAPPVPPPRPPPQALVTAVLEVPQVVPRVSVAPGRDPAAHGPPSAVPQPPPPPPPPPGREDGSNVRSMVLPKVLQRCAAVVQGLSSWHSTVSSAVPVSCKGVRRARVQAHQQHACMHVGGCDRGRGVAGAGCESPRSCKAGRAACTISQAVPGSGSARAHVCPHAKCAGLLQTHEQLQGEENRCMLHAAAHDPTQTVQHAV